MALQNIRRKGAAAAAVLGLGALLVGCSREGALNGAQVPGTAAGAPLAVSCEPNQRAVVRQVALSAGLQTQVQCETVSGFAGANAAAFGGTSPAVSPVAYQPGFQPVSYGYTPPVPPGRARTAPAAHPRAASPREP